MPLTTTELLSLKIALGAEGTGAFETGVPVLAGEAMENLFGAAQPAGRVGGLELFHAAGWLLGAASVSLEAGLDAAAHALYRDIFAATRGRHLARIWNYVPAINEPDAAGLENYRGFCRGRSLAFEEHFGPAAHFRMPAASAVGCRSTVLTVTFAACAAGVVPRHVENPGQVAAYDYPAAYGPRAPSFARATVVAGGAEGATVFISGTAAIRGHATIATPGLREQVDCTLENLGGISRACGLGGALDEGRRSRRHFKVYVRHAHDQNAIASLLEERLLIGSDRVTYLQADICRSSLLVEVEATLFGVQDVG
jgi:enamine deaminase RidA (YjgF/YER057c/UK114 family)